MKSRILGHFNWTSMPFLDCLCKYYTNKSHYHLSFIIINFDIAHLPVRVIGQKVHIVWDYVILTNVSSTVQLLNKVLFQYMQCVAYARRGAHNVYVIMDAEWTRMKTNIYCYLLSLLHEKLDYVYSIGYGTSFHTIFHHLQSIDKSLIDCLYEMMCSIWIAKQILDTFWCWSFSLICCNTLHHKILKDYYSTTLSAYYLFISRWNCMTRHH